MIGRILIGLAMIGVWMGCAKSATSTANTKKPTTYLGVMNVAPYSPAATVYLNNTQATNALNAGSFSSSYASLTPGIYDVQFKVAGVDSLLAEVPSVSYDSMGFYTLILYNDSIHGPAKAVRLTDDFSAITLSNTYVRFIHMCLELPMVDLYLNGVPVQQNRVAKDVVPNETFAKFQSISPATYSLQIKKSGTDSVLTTLNNINLQAGNAYTIFLSGSTTNNLNPISLNIVQALYY